MPASLKDSAAAAVRALQQWYGAASYAQSTGLYHWDSPDLAKTLGGGLGGAAAAAFANVYGLVDNAEDMDRWWSSANAITALIDYMLLTKDLTYLYVVDYTFNKAQSAWRPNVGVIAGSAGAGALGGAAGGAALGFLICGPACAIGGGVLGAFLGLFGGGGAAAASYGRIYNTNFLNNNYDDEGWWALAWIKAYDLTNEPKYLDMAKTIFADMIDGWDDTCSGGLFWAKGHNGPDGKIYKNSIPNELLLAVAAGFCLRLNKIVTAQPIPIATSD